MKSTPAVFYMPTLSMESTPSVSTPSVFENEPYPWAATTPEDSPRCWEVTPSWPYVDGFQHEVSGDTIIPRELLQAVCGPFFDQMLTVLQHALQTQTHPGNKLAEISQDMVRTANNSFQSVLHSACPLVTKCQSMPDEESTEADELGAFACLFSGPSSEGEELNSSMPEVFAPLSPDRDSDEASDSDKSNMVCRHWKSKGWCRLESNCKFLHPEHKRGVAATKPSNRSGTSSGMSATTGRTLMIALDGELLVAPERRRKRGGRNRSNRIQQACLGNQDQDMTGACTQFNYEEPLAYF